MLYGGPIETERNRALEEAARVADGFDTHERDNEMWTVDCTHKSYADRVAQQIAAAIGALREDK